MVHRNHFLCVCQQSKSCDSKVEFRLADNHCKTFLKASKFASVNKTRKSITSMKFGFRDFWQTSKIVLSNGRFTIPHLFNVPKVLFVASDKTKLFTENSSKNSNHDGSGIYLSVFPSGTNLKLHIITVTPKLVKNIVINLDS